MCECGCSSGSDYYRLPGPNKIFYIVEVYPGCRDCSASPGVGIKKVDPKNVYYDDFKDCKLLPMFEINDTPECPIACGLDPDEFNKAVKKEISTYIEDIKKYDKNSKPRWLDKYDVDEIAEQLWDNAIRGEIEVVKAKA